MTKKRPLLNRILSFKKKKVLNPANILSPGQLHYPWDTQEINMRLAQALISEMKEDSVMHLVGSHKDCDGIQKNLYNLCQQLLSPEQFRFSIHWAKVSWPTPTLRTIELLQHFRGNKNGVTDLCFLDTGKVDIELMRQMMIQHFDEINAARNVYIFSPVITAFARDVILSTFPRHLKHKVRFAYICDDLDETQQIESLLNAMQPKIKNTIMPELLVGLEMFELRQLNNDEECTH